MKKASYIDNLEEWQKSFQFYCPIKVRFCETDMFGHLNNANAFVYFEEARIEFLREYGFLDHWLNENNDTGTVVANIQCDFIKQVYFDERLKMYIKVNGVSNSSFDLHFMAVNQDGEICLTGRNTIVQFSKSTGRSVRLSPEIKGKLEGLIL